MNIKDDTKTIQWFSLIDLSEKSQETYLIYMKKFCLCVGKSPSEMIKEAEDETRKGLLLSERKTFEYITKFKICIKNLAPKTQSLGMAVVKSFFKTFDIPLSSSIQKQKKSSPKRENQNVLKKEDIEKMITYAKNSRDKAIFLCMATSGMGMQEIINLKISDITFGEDGVSKISLRRLKVGTDLITFISPEATKALNEYLEERKRDPRLDIKNKNDYVFVTYSDGYGNGKTGKKGGKIGNRAFSKIFRDLGHELGYSNGADFIKTRSHALRKFFTSTLESAGFPKPKVDFMVGHTVNGVDLAYFNRDPAELKELYIKYLNHITFFEKTIEVRSLDTKDVEKLNELAKENADLKDEITKLKSNTGDVEALKARLNEMEAQRKNDKALNEDMINALINARIKDMMNKVSIKNDAQ